MAHCRPHLFPNAGFLAQLMRYEEKVRHIEQSTLLQHLTVHNQPRVAAVEKELATLDAAAAARAERNCAGGCILS